MQYDKASNQTQKSLHSNRTYRQALVYMFTNGYVGPEYFHPQINNDLPSCSRLLTHFLHAVIWCVKLESSTFQLKQINIEKGFAHYSSPAGKSCQLDSSNIISMARHLSHIKMKPYLFPKCYPHVVLNLPGRSILNLKINNE